MAGDCDLYFTRVCSTPTPHPDPSPLSALKPGALPADQSRDAACPSVCCCLQPEEGVSAGGPLGTGREGRQRG